MKLSVEMIGRIWASGRNYISLVAGAAASIGLMSAAQQKGISEGLDQITAGVAQIVHGGQSIWVILVAVGGPFVGAVAAWYAQRSAKAPAQAAALVAQANDPTNPAKQEEAKVVVSNAAVLSGAQKVVNPEIADNDKTLSAVTKS